MAQLAELIENTVGGLGYEVVDFERAGRRLLRVFIDWPEQSIDRLADQRTGGITLDDCETVSRQLQYVLTVENVDYERLEVSSPGLDRPLKKLADFARFTGCEVTVTLNRPFNGRKRYRGILLYPSREDKSDTIGLQFDGKTGPAQLDFTLADIERVRLVPQVDFRSRKP